MPEKKLIDRAKSSGIRSTNYFTASIPYAGSSSQEFVRFGYVTSDGEVVDDIEVYIEDLRSLNAALKAEGYSILPSMIPIVHIQ